MTDEETFDLLAEKVATRLVSLVSDLVTFPTVEDVERIRDHVSPNGAAYKNGYKAGLLGAGDALRSHGFPDAADMLDRLARIDAKLRL